jgi:hypothetical protein
MPSRKSLSTTFVLTLGIKHNMFKMADTVSTKDKLRSEAPTHASVNISSPFEDSEIDATHNSRNKPKQASPILDIYMRKQLRAGVT